MAAYAWEWRAECLRPPERCYLRCRVTGRVELQHLGQADVVTRRVAKRCVDAIGLRCRRVVESYAAGRELVIARLAVVGLEKERPARALGHQLGQRRAALGVEHGRTRHWHEYKPDVVLPRGPHRQPAEVPRLHGDVGPDLPAERLGVEAKCLILVVNPKLGIGDLNHRGSSSDERALPEKPYELAGRWSSRNVRFCGRA